MPHDSLTPAADILANVAPLRPSLGGRLEPTLLAARLGATHCAGRYAFTPEPYVVEGAKTIHGRLGYRHLKLWFYDLEQVYSQHSNWNLADYPTLAARAAHPYFRAAFAEPFATIAVEVKFSPAGDLHPRPAGHMVAPDMDFAHEEEELYQLTKYLIATYRGRAVTFILQNWEGDWMIREFPGAMWTDPKKIPTDLDQRVETYVRWFAARQRGVSRARAELSAAGSKCRVLHAIEVNRVFDTLLGAPTLCNRVLPRVEVDLISWSAYDGMQIDAHGTGDAAAIGIWQGIEIIRAHARTFERDGKGRPQVMLGEFGVAENKLPPEKPAEDILEGTVAAALAQDASLLHYWELFCNESNDPKYRDAPLDRNLRADELGGFWLIKPDDTLGRAGAWFAKLLGR
jgi:hypothetical protein